MLCALVIVTVLAPPLAHADEYDWVYMPVAERDYSYAVHLSKLKFRPDGLLDAATRYPLPRVDGWDAQIYKGARYGYTELLIDCETGAYIELAHSLLAPGGSELTSKASTPEEQLKAVEELNYRYSNTVWPRQGDIFIACAAASSPTFRQRRAARAAQPLPLWSARPLINMLADETKALSAAVHLHYDVKPILEQPGTSAAALFEDIRFQYARWLKSFNGSYSAQAAIATLKQKAVARRIEQLRHNYAGLNSINGYVIEYTRSYAPPESDIAEQSTSVVLDVRRADCEYGVAVTIGRQKLRQDGVASAVIPLPARPLLLEIMQLAGDRDGQRDERPLSGFTLDPFESEICHAIAEARTAQAQPTGAEADESALSLGVTHESLSKARTPAAMLLAIRAAQRINPLNTFGN